MIWQDSYHLLLDRIAGKAQQFAMNAAHIKKCQRDKLFEILHANHLTSFGLLHQFSSIKTIEEFQRKVPLSLYAHYEDVFSAGNAGYFLDDTVTNFSWTSGTSSAHKKIPISKSLINDFEAGLLPWIDNLLSTIPELTSGPAYWIIGPQTKIALTDVFEDLEDTEYFSPELALSLSHILCVPPSVKRQGGFREWAFVTLLYLMLESKLSWISVWSPTLLIELLRSVKELHPLLVQSFTHKSCNGVDLDLPLVVVDMLNRRLFERQAVCERVVKILTDNKEDLWSAVWPNLQLCSCWKDGWAELFLPQLSHYLPRVKIQGKGLLATEAIVSIPFNDNESSDPVLAYRSHFFEFRLCNTEDVFLAHELKEGEKYEVIVTTSGGLYRYQLEDIVLITGFIDRAPRMRFIGRKNLVSDLCGEKLHEDHVAQCLSDVSKEKKLDLHSAYLRPVIKDESRFYQLVISQNQLLQLADLADLLDRALCTNPHYAACRKLNQLSSIECITEEIKVSNSLSTTKHFCLRTQPKLL